MPHAVNQGTVKNCLSAVKQAKGKYVFLSSPGDLLYDKYTLRDFFRFAEKNHAKVIFGDALNYVFKNEEIVVNDNLSPLRPIIYRFGNMMGQQIDLLMGDWILGASYFRETSYFIKYLERVSMHCKYVEDSSTSLLYVLDGMQILHYDRYIVWYEYGTGISTSKNNKWDQILQNEIKSIFDLILNEYSDNKNVLAAYSFRYSIPSKNECIFKSIFSYPSFYIQKTINKLEKKKEIKEDYSNEITNLKRIIKENRYE